jgi:hypothetical protein
MRTQTSRPGRPEQESGSGNPVASSAPSDDGFVTLSYETFTVGNPVATEPRDSTVKRCEPSTRGRTTDVHRDRARPVLSEPRSGTPAPGRQAEAGKLCSATGLDKPTRSDPARDTRLPVLAKNLQPRPNQNIGRSAPRALWQPGCHRSGTHSSPCSRRSATSMHRGVAPSTQATEAAHETRSTTAG